MCYLFPSLLDNYKYIPLPIFNADNVVMSCGNSKNFTYTFLEKAGHYRMVLERSALRTLDLTLA
jgi:hypothetical protein